MKFLNKKEQVFDIQLTPLGKHKLSAGVFEPVYYAFFDDNILYDIEYAGRSETQNTIHERIKQNTQYLETQAIFQERLSGSVTQGGLLLDTIYEQEENAITSYGSIGDAKLLSETTDVAPAWKLVAMQSEITGAIQTNFEGTIDESTSDVKRSEASISQINITASYYITTDERANITDKYSFQDLREIESTTGVFADGRILRLVSDNPLIYLEELNTELLTENFNIEVFKIENDDFRKLYFQANKPQIVNGLMVSPQQEKITDIDDTNSVEYYFSILKDYQIDSKIACRYVEQFNSENYMIDLDHDCSDVEGRDLYFDIYGRVTESEICQD
jgi:hypothetical protein